MTEICGFYIKMIFSTIAQFLFCFLMMTAFPLSPTMQSTKPEYKDWASSFFLEEHTDIRFRAAALLLEVMFLSLYPLKGFYQLLLGYLACYLQNTHLH